LVQHMGALQDYADLLLEQKKPELAFEVETRF
jgi:hypothetical protein